MVTVEPATASDADAVADLWVALARNQRRHGSHVLDESNRGPIRESMAEHAVDGLLLVARKSRADDDIVGFVRFGLERGPVAQDVTRGIVNDLFVVREERRAGVGTRLLDAAESALLDRGADAITLSAMAANDEAIRLYERRGYRPHRIEFEREVENDKRSRRDR